MNIVPLAHFSSFTLCPPLSLSQTFDRMQAQIGSMNLPGRLPAIERETEVAAFEIASKTDGYCGMCNVPGYVQWIPQKREGRRNAVTLTLAQ